MISRRKSWAAKRPSPSWPGSVFDVATMDTPRAESSERRRDTSIGVARIVELELVDAERTLWSASASTALFEAESADDVCQLVDEGSESLRRRNAVEDRRQQVSLTDTEPAVEVQAGAGRLGLLAEQSAASTTTDLG